MKIKDLKVVNLNITEDNYEYKAMFRLCSDSVCLDLDLQEMSNDAVVKEIKESFKLEEDEKTIRETIMQKVMDASNLESRNNSGENYNNSMNDEKTHKGIDSLSIS